MHYNKINLYHQYPLLMNYSKKICYLKYYNIKIVPHRSWKALTKITSVDKIVIHVALTSRPVSNALTFNMLYKI